MSSHCPIVGKQNVLRYICVFIVAADLKILVLKFYLEYYARNGLKMKDNFIIFRNIILNFS